MVIGDLEGEIGSGRGCSAADPVPTGRGERLKCYVTRTPGVQNDKIFSSYLLSQPVAGSNGTWPKLSR